MAFWKKKKTKAKKITSANKPASKKTESPKPSSKQFNIPEPEPIILELVTKKKAETPKPKPVPAKEKPKPKKEPPKPKVNPEKEFLRVFKELTYRHRAWDVWRDFIFMAAAAFSNSVDKQHFDEREARYMKTIKKYRKDEQKLFPELLALTVMALEENPEQDFLGTIFMKLNLGDNMKGQIFTPYHVCELMARVSIGENLAEQVREKGFITINDPCCGAGATLIAGVNEAKRQLEKVNLNFQNHVLVAAQDIDETVALMCYIQLSLLGVAGYVKVANSLTEPIDKNDTKEKYWFTPMYFSEVWFYRKLFNMVDDLTVKGEECNNE